MQTIPTGVTGSSGPISLANKKAILFPHTLRVCFHYLFIY